MNAETRQILDEQSTLHRGEARSYLAGLAEAPLFGMGRGVGPMLLDQYGDNHLDFGPSSLALVTGHSDPKVIDAIKGRIWHSISRDEYGQCLDFDLTRYAHNLSERFGSDRDGAPRQVLFMASVYEARMAAAQIVSEAGGGHFLFLLDATGFPRDGGEVQDEVHRAKAQGLKIIADETYTGFGRTGTFGFYEQFGLNPDVVVLGEAVGAGLPMTAVIAPYPLFTGHAFEQLLAVVKPSAHPVACAAGRAVLEQIDTDVLSHVTDAGRIFGEELGSICEQFSHILTAVKGVGFMWAIALTQPSRTQEFYVRCRNAGLIISPDLRLTPPLATSTDQLKLATDALTAVCIDMGEGV